MAPKQRCILYLEAERQCENKIKRSREAKIRMSVPIANKYAI